MMSTLTTSRCVISRLVVATTLGAMVALTGCTTTQSRDIAEEAAISLQNQNDELAAENERLRGELRDVQMLASARGDQVTDLEGRIAQGDEQSGRINQLKEQIRKMDDALTSLPSGGGLDARTALALTRLAESYPDLMSFDADRGLLRFKSDLTFAPGSDTLKSEARAGLEQIARVMSTSDASDYYLHVIGHTDSVRIANPATKAKHATNRHLSVHRAIAVSEALQRGSMALPADRILVGGWGQYDPLVPNNDKGGTAANRRVEIWILASSERRASMGGASGMMTESAPEERQVGRAPAPVTEDEIPIK